MQPIPNGTLVKAHVMMGNNLATVTGIVVDYIKLSAGGIRTYFYEILIENGNTGTITVLVRPFSVIA